MAADHASAVKGGNWQIFEKFVNSSGATLKLNTTVSLAPASQGWLLTIYCQVKSIAQKSGAKWAVEITSGDSKEYNHVIIAAPFHQTGITLHSSVLDAKKVAELIPPQPYVHLHVTLLSTIAPHPNPQYFNLSEDGKPPTTILTTYDSVRTQGVRDPEFNSLSYHGVVREPEEGEDPEFLVKIFSKEAVSDAWLSNMFSGKVGWVYRKVVSAGIS
jgi:prenylcysteine oxidase / farnesylcysteine lyase